MLPHTLAGWNEVEKILNNTTLLCEEIRNLSRPLDENEGRDSQQGRSENVASLRRTIFLNLQKACECIHGELSPKHIFEGSTDVNSHIMLCFFRRFKFLRGNCRYSQV